MYMKSTKVRIAGALFALALVLQATVPLLIPSASAGTLTNTLVRFDRLAASTATTGLVCAKEASSGTDAVASVTFPTGFTVSATTSNWSVSTSTTTDWPSGAVAWTGIAAPTGSGNFTISGQTVNFQSGDLNTTSLYCFNWTNSAALTTGSAGNYSGTVTTETSAPATIDSGNYSVTIVGAGADQVTVTATVNPAFSMSLNTSSDALGTLTVGAVKTSASAIEATISTNAANGWYLWGKDSNHGLNSTTASYTIGSNCSGGAGTNGTLTAGTEGYNLGASVFNQGTGSGGTATTSGTGLVFDNASGTAGKGAGLCSTNYQTIASSNGTANAAKIDMLNNVAISGVTKPASDYTDLETFVGAGLF